MFTAPPMYRLVFPFKHLQPARAPMGFGIDVDAKHDGLRHPLPLPPGIEEYAPAFAVEAGARVTPYVVPRANHIPRVSP